MNGTLASSSTEMCDLESGASADVMADAIARRLRVFIHTDPTTDAPCVTGTLVGQNRSELVIELENCTPSKVEAFQTAMLRVSFEDCGVRYAFESQCSRASAATGSSLINVLKPHSVTRAERRRSPRRRLREPTCILLHTVDRDPSWRCLASLLNVSTDGLAVWIAASDTAEMKVGDRLRVSFDLGPSQTTFNLTARVNNMTTGGSTGRVILGLEFVAADNPDFNPHQLEEAMVGTGPT